MTFSQLAQRISLPNKEAAKKFTQQAIDSGHDIINLSVAETDLSLPYVLTESYERLIRESKHNKYIPSNGIDELREKLADWDNQDHKLSLNKENIAITSGARGGITVLMQALLNPNDEVLLPAPYWNGYPNIIKLVGAVAKVFLLDEEESFYPTIEQLEKLVSPRTKMLILNNPHNPTGVIWDKESLSEIIAWAEKKNIFVLADEVCWTSIFDDTAFHSLVTMTKDFSNLAVVRAFSKSLSIPGWRIGWVIGAPELISQIEAIQKSTTGGVSSLTQQSLVDAWESIIPWIQQQVAIHQDRRDALYNQLCKLHGFRVFKPQGGIALIANVKYYLGNKVGGEVPQTAQEFAEIVLKKTGVHLGEGELFGIDGVVRFCFTRDNAILEEAVRRIGNILEQ